MPEETEEQSPVNDDLGPNEYAPGYDEDGSE